MTGNEFYIKHMETDNLIATLAARYRLYLYHKVMTRFVRFPLWSLENDRARPKSASFKFPSLSIRRLDPAPVYRMSDQDRIMSLIRTILNYDKFSIFTVPLMSRWSTWLT